MWDAVLKAGHWLLNQVLKKKAEEKKSNEDNKVIQVLQEQLSKAEVRELEDSKRIRELEEEVKRMQHEMNELLRDLIRKKANKK